MGTPYLQLAALLARQKVVSVTGHLELEPTGPLAAEMIAEQITKAFPGWIRKQGPLGPVWIGRARSVAWQAPNVVFQANLAEQEKPVDAAGAFALIEGQLHKLFDHLTQPKLAIVRMAAMIVDLQFSTLELAPIGSFISSFLDSRVHESGTVVDAEWRAAFMDGPYFTNLTLGTYETRSVSLRTTVGPKGPRVTESSTSDVTDAGLLLRIDVNTKVNVFTRAGPIIVTGGELTALVLKGQEAVARALGLLQSGGR
jgi:hypothetical protein